MPLKSEVILQKSPSTAKPRLQAGRFEIRGESAPCGRRGHGGDPCASLRGARKAAVRSPAARTRHGPSRRGVCVSAGGEGAFALERRKVKANTSFLCISKIGRPRARAFSEKRASGGEQGGKREPGADFARGGGPWEAGGKRRGPRRSGLRWRRLGPHRVGARGCRGCNRARTAKRDGLRSPPPASSACSASPSVVSLRASSRSPSVGLEFFTDACSGRERPGRPRDSPGARWQLAASWSHPASPGRAGG